MLYQEVRPDNLDDIIGNSITIGALRNMLRKPSASRSHCYLLKGPNGCGKTTIARILAGEFGSTEDSTIRISANNTNGIETVKEISCNAHLSSLGGTPKTYIIDESHELTSRAQEGFLDIIEDNPPHCYFIFCTTDPEKISKGIHSRSTEYEVKLLSNKEIIEVVNRAVKKILSSADISAIEEQLSQLVSSPRTDKTIGEEIALKEYLFVLNGLKDISPDVIEAIALTCDGSPRAALVALEMVAGIADTNEAFEILVSGTEGDATVLDLFNLLIMAPEKRRERWNYILNTYAAIGEDNEKIRRAVLTFLFNKLRKQTSIEVALDITHLLRIFSMSTFYGGKSAMGALIARACFETWKD